jgi:pimeloyl-ACP methyl ester carboxylesterase
VSSSSIRFVALAALVACSCANPVRLRHEPELELPSYRVPTPLAGAAGRLERARRDSSVAGTRGLVEVAREAWHQAWPSGSLDNSRMRMVAFEIYERALEGLLARIVETPATTVERATEAGIVLDRRDGAWPASWFRRLEPAVDLDVLGFGERYRRAGFGLPVVAESAATAWSGQEASLTPEGLFLPATALLTFPSDECALLTIANPREVGAMRDGERTLPVAADYTTPYADLLARSKLVTLGRAGFRDPGARGRRGLFLLEPYQPAKTPVVLVHGLASSPFAWRELTNTIFGRPELRDRFQVWHYFYPTGAPYLYAAQMFRETLTRALRELDPLGRDPASKDVVLVGHSMGGLISKASVANAGPRVWDAAFTVPPDELDVTPEDRAALKSVFMFEALPFVTRAVFIMTPHGGSNVALGLLGGLGDRLVRLPSDYSSLFRRVTAKNLEKITPEMRAVLSAGGPTSVRALRPSHPVLLAFRDVPVDARIPFHLVVGNLGEGDERVGDGVVSYESQTLDGAASTAIVHAGHRQLERRAVNDAIAEILLQHVRERPRAVALRTLARGSCTP